MGQYDGKTLKRFIETWPGMYGIPVPPRQYETMNSAQRARVQIAMEQNTTVRPGEEWEPPMEPEAEEPRRAMPMPIAFASGEDLPTYVSRPDNTFIFGAVSDSHLGSKYERLDVLNDLYDRFVMAEVDRVFHAGNWIDGYKVGINEHDVHIHHMEGQLRYLAQEYPKRGGLTTYAVTGEDHEGWWARSQGIDIGKRAEQTMREYGRDDWVNLGFMESHVRLVNANSGAETIMAVVHPGGGTAYALSYSVQKIVEALEGGEKPAVALYGHYHKLWSGNIRNVWVAVTGCTQDQTVFTRNKIKQEVHVGGFLIALEQDPASGAITGFAPKMHRYFVKGFYGNNRWSKSGGVTLPQRTIGGR